MAAWAASLSIVWALIRSSDKDLRQTGCIHPDCPCHPIAVLQPPISSAMLPSLSLAVTSYVSVSELLSLFPAVISCPWLCFIFCPQLLCYVSGYVCFLCPQLLCYVSGSVFSLFPAVMLCLWLCFFSVPSCYVLSLALFFSLSPAVMLCLCLCSCLSVSAFVSVNSCSAIVSVPGCGERAGRMTCNDTSRHSHNPPRPSSWSTPCPPPSL